MLGERGQAALERQVLRAETASRGPVLGPLDPVPEFWEGVGSVGLGLPTPISIGQEKERKMSRQ